MTRFGNIARAALLPGLCLASVAAYAMPPFGSWSTPLNIETLQGSSSSVNTPFVDGCASHSRDGLTIVFNSNRDGTQDLFMATRSSKSDGFGAPTKLPAPVNGSANESCPTITNGATLYFSSDRHDPAYDIYMTRRGPKGWSEPVRLGPNINTPGNLEETPDFYEDEQGREVMVFTRRPPSGLSGEGGKLYQSVDGGPASLVQGGPHSSAGDNRASVTHDGKTIFWDSVRGGNADIYYATRKSTSDVWGTANRLSDVSSLALDLRPYISWDGTFMTFSSNRSPGTESPAPDIWYVTREKAVGKNR